MKLPHLLLSGVAAVALALPVAVIAQTAPAAPPAAARHHHGPGMMRMFRTLNLTQQQQQQIKTLMTQFRTAHPKGSPPDRAARKALHEQIMAVLTPQQKTQLKAERQKMRAEHPGWGKHEGAEPSASPSPAV